MRVYPTAIQYGDPLYMEATVTNKGEESVDAWSPDLVQGTFAFEFYDAKTLCSTNSRQGAGLGCGVDGGKGRVTYEPAKPVRHYWMAFLPSLPQMEQAFWKPISNGQSIVVTAEYCLNRNVVLQGNLETLRINPRNDAEFAHLKQWAKQEPGKDGPNYRGVSPWVFGIYFGRSMSRADTIKILGPMRPGELADLLQLTVRLQEISEAKPEERAEHNRLLVEWLQAQHEIKRKALADEIVHIIKGNPAYNLDGTKEAMLDLLEER